MMGKEQLQSEMNQAITFAAENLSDELFLSQMKLTALDPNIATLHTVKSIYLFGNELTEFPEALCQLTQLERIYISGNMIAHIPEEIGNLTNLKLLDIKNNEIRELPKSFGKLTALETLYIGNNHLNDFPDVVTHCVSLKKLDAQGNQFSVLPSEINQLQALKQLDLSNNKLTQLPATLAEIQSLTKLNVANNELTTLPPSFAQLVNLNSNNQRYEWERGLKIDGNKFQLSDTEMKQEPIALIQTILGTNQLEVIQHSETAETFVRKEESVAAAPKKEPSPEKKNTEQHKKKVVATDETPIVISVYGQSEYKVLDILEQIFEINKEKNQLTYQINQQEETFDLQNYGFLPIKSIGDKLLKMPNNINLIVVDHVEALGKIKKLHSKGRTMALVMGKVPERHLFEFPVIAVNHSIKCSQLVANHLSLFINKIRNKHVAPELGVLLENIQNLNAFYIDEVEFDQIAEDAGLVNKLEKSYAKKYFRKKGWMYQFEDDLLLQNKWFVDKKLLYSELCNVFNAVFLAKHQGEIDEQDFVKVVGNTYSEKTHLVLLALMIQKGWCKRTKNSMLHFPSMFHNDNSQLIPIKEKSSPTPKEVKDIETVVDEVASKEHTKVIPASSVMLNKEKPSVLVEHNESKTTNDKYKPVFIVLYVLLGMILGAVLLWGMQNNFFSNDSLINETTAINTDEPFVTEANEIVEDKLVAAPSFVVPSLPAGYYMVVASYVSEINANLKEEELVGNGYDAFTFQINENLYWVSLFLSENLSDAERVFGIKTQGNQNYWMIQNDN